MKKQGIRIYCDVCRKTIYLNEYYPELKSLEPKCKCGCNQFWIIDDGIRVKFCPHDCNFAGEIYRKYFDIGEW